MAIGNVLKIEKQKGLIRNIKNYIFSKHTWPLSPRSMPSKSKGSKGASLMADKGLEAEVLRRLPSLRNSALYGVREFY